MLAQALVLVLSSSFFPQGVRIGPELPRNSLGDVEDFQLDAVGGVVFKGDCTRDGQLELYRARVDGSLLQTTLGLPSSSGIESYRLTPDGQRVLFMSALGLHSAPLDGSLAPVLLFAGAVLNYTVTPDSLVVLYGRDLHDLHSVPITGGASTLLEQVAVTSFVGGDFQGSADSSRVLYRIKVGSEFELRSRPVSGGPSLLHADTGTVVDFKLSPSGTEILFRSTVLSRTALYRVPYAGGVPIELSPPLAARASVLEDYTFDRSGTRALFRATTDSPTDPDSSSELWIAPIDGSTPAVKVNGPLAVGMDVVDFRFDDTRILYRATGPGVFELFSVPLDLSVPPVSLSAPMLPGMTVNDYLLTADGARAVFVSNRLDGTRRRLWSVAATGGTPLELDGRNLASTTQLALDSLAGRVLFAAEESPDQGLFLVPVDASTPARRLDGPAVAGSRVTSYGVSGDRAVYVASEELAETFELHSAPLDLVQPSTRLSRASDVFTFGGAIGTFDVSPDGSVAVLATSGAAPVVYTSSLARPSAVARSLPAGPGATIGELAFSPDSTAFACTLLETNGAVRLLAASTRTRDAAVRLDAAPVTGAPSGLVVGPGPARVFYLAPTAGHAAELCASFLDGLTPPVVLNAPLVSGTSVSGSVRAFDLSAGGQHLIYLADQEKVNRVELYSVSSGGGPALRLNGALGFGEDVLQARIAPDGQRALFVADDVLDGIENLYVVPLDGSAAPLPLTGHASGAHSVSLLAFTLDGASALYRVRFPGGAAELRRVSLDGSQAPLTLDDDAFDPTELVLTADGTRVVYRLLSSGSLRSTRLDGSAAALELDDLGSIDPAGHQLTDDSTHVVYRKNLQLWRARVDGSTAPVRLGRGLGTIYRHELTRTGRILAGTATQLFVFETLTATPRFLAPLDGTRRFLATPEGRRVLSMSGELYLDYLTRPHLPR